jgi:hypothetical protein
MLSRLWWYVRAHVETFRQNRTAVITAEALIWHHGCKGLDAALKAAEAPKGELREDVRAELVAKVAADRYLSFKHADLAQRAAMLEVWSRRRGQMIRVCGRSGLEHRSDVGLRPGRRRAAGDHAPITDSVRTSAASSRSPSGARSAHPS